MNRPDRRRAVGGSRAIRPAGVRSTATRSVVALGVALCLAGCAFGGGPTTGATPTADPDGSGRTPSVAPPAHSATVGASPIPTPVHVLRAMTWGGEGVELLVAPDGAATVEFDCATGRIPGPLALGADGSFGWPGEFTAELGGPVREGGAPPPQPARYGGIVAGASMTLEVQLTGTGERLGQFDLVAGEPALLRKCL